MPDLTPTQRRIADLLADGLPHTRAEIAAAAGDPEMTTNTIRVHVHHVRKELRKFGQDVICQYRHPRHFLYRRIALVSFSD